MALICGTEVPYVCNPCVTIERGRIRGVAFLRTSRPPFDYSSPTAWQTAFCDGDAFIVPNIRGESNGGAIVEGEGFGNMATYVIGRDYEITYMDPSLPDNCAFYAAIENSAEWRIAFVTATQLWISSNAVSVQVTTPIASGLNSEVLFNVVVKFTEGGLLCSQDKPVGTFDRCPAPCGG